MKDEMVKVLLYNNGDIEIEPTESEQLTHHMFFFGGEKGCGEFYICKKGMEAFYLKRMISKRKKELAKQIKELKAVEVRVNEKLSELKGDAE